MQPGTLQTEEVATFGPLGEIGVFLERSYSGDREFECLRQDIS